MKFDRKCVFVHFLKKARAEMTVNSHRSANDFIA